MQASGTDIIIVHDELEGVSLVLIREGTIKMFDSDSQKIKEFGPAQTIVIFPDGATQIETLSETQWDAWAGDLKVPESKKFDPTTKIVKKVPGWIKNIVKWWDEGQLDDADFVTVIQYMVKEKVIDIPDLPKQNIFDPKQEMPFSAKVTAKWWAIGEMSEDEFINDSIKSLYEYGIISNENLVEATTVDIIKRGTVQISIVKESSIPDIVESYNPPSIKVYSGTTATWTNDDSAAHTVTSGTVSDGIVGSMFDSGLIPAGSTWSYKFEKSGEWDYFCTLHPWMEGTVSVN